MKKHFLKSFALLAMLFSALTVSAQSGVDWSSITTWLGNGTPDAANTNNWKYFTPDGVSVVNVQMNEGKACIYAHIPEIITTCNVNDYKLSGAAIFLFLGSFTEQETKVVLEHNSGERILWIYNANGTPNGSTEPELPDTEVPTLTSVELFGAAQNFVLLTPTASDNKGVTSYLIAKNGGAESEVTPDATTGQIKITGLTLNKTYTYSVKAKDAAGNVSAAKEITFSTLDNVFCGEEVLPTVQFITNQKLTLTAKKVSDKETYFALSSPTSTLTSMFNVNTTNKGGGTLPAGYVEKDGWNLDGNTLSKTVTWETYPTSPITIAITAKRAPGAGEGNLIGLSAYSIDLSNTCGETPGEGGEDPVEPTPESIIESTFFAPGWTEETNSTATYNAETGTITVALKSTFSERWQAQVKVKHDIAFSADKYYQFSAKFHATEEIKNVMIKVDDNAAIVEDGAVTLPANEDFVYTPSAAKGIAGNNKIIVFDFGYASPCQITISDISIVEVTPPAIEHPSPAPVPTVPEEQVFSIYSNAYNPAVHRTMGGWGQSTKEEEVQLAEGDKAFYYTNCNYLGWELNSTYDMTAYPMLHLDIYVATAGSIQFSPVWQTEKEYLKTYNLQAGWNSIDVNLEAEITGVNLTTIYQLKWANMPATCYIDNVYFFNDGTTEPVEPTPVESNYCQNTLTNGANSIDLTCEKVSVGNYRIIIEGSNLGQNGMDNATSGSFIIVNNEKTENITKGSLLKQYINTTLSTTSKVICEVPSTVDPKFDGNLYIMMPGEVNFGPVSDVIWGTCPEAEEDDQAPTMTSATVESYTHNSAVIAVAASDNVGVAKYQIVDAGNSVDQTLTATDGKIALSGLASATTYNLTIYAIDKAGNKSDGLAVAAFTTDALVYCDFPTGNNGDANFGNPDGRILVSLIKITPQNVRVVVKSADAATKNLDLIYIEAAGANPHATTVGADVASSDLRVMSADISYPTIPAKYSFMIQWSNPDWNGRWQINLNDVLESNLCPLPTDDEAPVMVSASLGSVTHNSAVLSVSATDNDEVANYHVVDATNNYDETIAPVGDQITLTDLTPSTTYNFTVTAVDLAGNESANNKTIVVTTDALVYCDFPTGHEGNANFGDANGRCLLTLTKLGNTQIRITVKPNYDNGATQKLDFLYVVANGANPNPATVGDPKLSEGGVDALSVDINYQTLTYPIGSIEIKWSTIGMDGEWATTVTNILESNLCLPIIVDENTDPATLPNGATCDVQFAREMTVVNDIWNTIALPFGMNAEQIARTFGEGTLVAKLQHSSSVASLEEMKLRFDYVDEIEAGTPYIILPMESGKDVVISGVTINTTTNPIVANQVTMHPVLETISYNYDKGDPIKFFLAADGYLHYNEASNQIKGLRAYFTFDNVTTIAQASKVRARIVFDENTETSVDNITMDEVPVKVIQHGQLIIIRNGVKYNVQGQKL